MAKRITPQQRKFVSEYLKNGGNGTKAAIAAGFKESNAADTAHDLLSRSDITRELEERGTKAIEVADADVARITRELAALGFSDLTTILNPDGGLRPLSQWPKEITVCIASMEFEDTIVMEPDPTDPSLPARERHVQYVSKIRLWSKTQALALLAQFRKMIGAGDSIPADQRQQFVGLAVTVAAGGTLNVQVNAAQSTVAAAGDSHSGTQRDVVVAK